MHCQLLKCLPMFTCWAAWMELRKRERRRCFVLCFWCKFESTFCRNNAFRIHSKFTFPREARFTIFSPLHHYRSDVFIHLSLNHKLCTLTIFVFTDTFSMLWTSSHFEVHLFPQAPVSKHIFHQPAVRHIFLIIHPETTSKAYNLQGIDWSSGSLFPHCAYHM